MIVGYARVSTDGQTLDAQQAALREAGAEQIFSEKISGAVTERKALARAIAALGPGDVLLVTRLDRLARSTRDLLNVLDAVAKAGAGFKSLADAWADTTTAHGRLMLTVLGGLAEFERELIYARTGEGRKRAQARGVRFGRKPKLTAHQRREALERRDSGRSPDWYRSKLRTEPFDDFEARSVVQRLNIFNTPLCPQEVLKMFVLIRQQQERICDANLSGQLTATIIVG
jgi:DNA invertase Pin-like site-specific DNA recombinase